MSIFAIVAVLGNTMFWCALIVDHKVRGVVSPMIGSRVGQVTIILASDWL